MIPYVVFLYFLLPAKSSLGLDADFEKIPVLGSQSSPRLLTGGKRDAFKYPSPQKHIVFWYDEKNGELFIGGTDIVLRFAIDDNRLLETFHLGPAKEQLPCSEDSCINTVTLIHTFQDSIFVCGTNELIPTCWKLFYSADNDSYALVGDYDGHGYSPYKYKHNALALSVDGDLYSAMPVDIYGGALAFRRRTGNRINVWMPDYWTKYPTFITLSLVAHTEDPVNDKIYVFFREKNPDTRGDADRWISRVSRICKVDQGGSVSWWGNRWTSFLMARLFCGVPGQSLYFNNVQDIFVLHAENWHDTRVYGVFTTGWNSTAVCIYSIDMIDDVFQTSDLKDYNREIPTPRPGTCVADSRNLPREFIKVVKYYIEMTDWVYPIPSASPFLISSYNYTKIVVDRVKAADGQEYNVLLLATDTGDIHKVVEVGSEPFVISETRFPGNSRIQTMTLDSKRKKLIVGFLEGIFTLDLQGCENYTQSCAECVLTRDPYCAWTTSGCKPTVPGAIQSIKERRITACPTQKAITSEWDSASSEGTETVHSVPQGVPFYLSCPIDSYQASYTWEHGGEHSPCLQIQSNCLHFIPSVTQETYGDYNCVSSENGFKKVMKKYVLREITSSSLKHPKRGVPSSEKAASSLLSPVMWMVLLSVLVAESF